MVKRRTAALEPKDAEHAIEIADRVWWVGAYRPESSFQAHVYLIEHGDQSVIVDPGSCITIDQTLRKVREVIDLDDVRYLICQHQDPDITASLPMLDGLITRDDACIMTHWRAETLLEHYGISLPFRRIEDQEWQLDLGGRLLRFVFTPYAHFPGAFCTFDEQEQVLFSSDLFGGFTEGFQLFAQDERFFEGLRPFHEHYIPSREIMAYALSKIDELPVRMIAPQHGLIVPEQLVEKTKDYVRGLDCGLYLLAGGEIRRLSQLNQVLRDITLAMLSYRDFRDIAQAVLSIVAEVLPATSLSFYARTERGETLLLEPGTRYRARPVDPPARVSQLLGLDRSAWRQRVDASFEVLSEVVSEVVSGGGSSGLAEGATAEMLLPLFSPGGGGINTVAVIGLNQAIVSDDSMESIIEQLSIPLQVAVEHQLVYNALDVERQQYYERAIRDPLTECFTRFYMHDTVTRLLHLHDRDETARVAVFLLDIDHFKAVNDAFGHNRGDDVLRQVGHVLLDNCRDGDLPVRLGGEEFAVFVAGTSADRMGCFAERVRARIEDLDLGEGMTGWRLTVSGGVAIRRQGESFEALLERADVALYRAKNSGRNRIVDADARPAAEH